MPKKGKKTTPPELDFLFERRLIPEDQYKDFWPRWWNSNKKEKEEIIKEYLIEESIEHPELPLKGILTKNKKLAEEQAVAINGKVVRKTKQGRFSKRGKFYQAVRKGNKRRKK